MAITSTNSLADKAQFERVLQQVCLTHRLERKDFLQAEQDPRTGHVKLAFKASPPSGVIITAAEQVQALMLDELRGEVIRAAVPELAKRLDVLIEAIRNPKTQIITLDSPIYNFNFKF
jgi:hypothetical protein